MSELNDLINEAREEINNHNEETETPTEEKEVERKIKELLLLSTDKEITKSVSYINKASAKVIEKLYEEYEAKRLEESTEFLWDMFISKFAMLMDGLDAIEKPDEMEKELKRDPLLKKDLKSVMTWLTPLIPFVGMLSGGITVGKHMWEKKNNKAEHDEHDEQAKQDE